MQLPWLTQEISAKAVADFIRVPGLRHRYFTGSPKAGPPARWMKRRKMVAI